MIIFLNAQQMPNITRTERVDDILRLLAQMGKMNIAELLDKRFPMHGNWQGLSLGQVVVVWPTYILSEGDHRLNCVQDWVAGLLLTLSLCLKANELRELDFSDDRLGAILTYPGQDANRESYETEQSRVTYQGGGLSYNPGNWPSKWANREIEFKFVEF
jgi:hypothetical protein